MGLVLKSDPAHLLIDALRIARTGELAVSGRLAHALLTDDDLVGHLAPREIQVFELLAQGVGRADIGRLMEPPAATSTVDTYLKRAARTYRSAGPPTTRTRRSSTSSETGMSTVPAADHAPIPATCDEPRQRLRNGELIAGAGS